MASIEFAQYRKGIYGEPHQRGRVSFSEISAVDLLV